MCDSRLLLQTRIFPVGIRTLIVLFILANSPLVIALQNKALRTGEGESGFIHLNNNAFASGDVLRYAAYLTEVAGSAPTLPETVFYFDLVNPQNKTVKHWRANAYKGISTGSIYLPDSLSTGVYLFRFYTQCMLMENPDNIPQKPIVVVNIAHENPTALPLSISLDALFQDMGNCEGPLHITPRMNQITTGDSLAFGIEIPASNPMDFATLSISVEKSSFPGWDSFVIDTVSGSKTIASKNRTSSGNQIRERQFAGYQGLHCIKEAGFYLLSGRVYNPQTDMPYDNKIVFISYSDTIVQLKYTQTDENGVFCFYLDESYDNKNLVLQVDGLGNNEQVGWEIYPKRAPGDDSSRVTTKAPINPGYAKKLEEIRKLSIADRIFNPLTKKVDARNSTPQRQFFSTPSYTVFPADYIHLDDFSDIARNILPRVLFRKSGDKFTVGMGDAENLTFHYGNILFLMDGHPFQNLELISGLSSSDIRSIDVVYTPFMYGDLAYNGLVSVHTSVGISLSADIFGSPIFIVDNPVHDEQYVAFEDRNNRKKVFSPSVLWIPTATLKMGESLKIATPRLFLTGDYVIRVAGFSNSGEFLQQMILFSVLGN